MEETGAVEVEGIRNNVKRTELAPAELTWARVMYEE